MKAIAVAVCLPAIALAQAFTFEIAGPIAAQDFRFKTAPFVFRTLGCEDPAKAQITATAEGLVDGARRSITLNVASSSKPGVYAVPRQWGAGRWVVILNGACGGAQVGAIVPAGPSGFSRTASKFFTHPAAPTDIEAALKAIPEGGYK